MAPPASELPEEALAAVRELRDSSSTVMRAGRHQRDEGEVQARQAQRGQADEGADQPGDDAGDEHQDGEGKPVATAGRSRTATHAPTASSTNWHSETMPDPPDQQAEARA